MTPETMSAILGAIRNTKEFRFLREQMEWEDRLNADDGDSLDHGDLASPRRYTAPQSAVEKYEQRLSEEAVRVHDEALNQGKNLDWATCQQKAIATIGRGPAPEAPAPQPTNYTQLVAEAAVEHYTQALAAGVRKSYEACEIEAARQISSDMTLEGRRKFVESLNAETGSRDWFVGNR